MSQKSMRKTQVRLVERDGRRAQERRNERLKWQIPFAAAGVLLLLAAAYFMFTTSTQPSQTGINGVNGPQFQSDTKKIDLGDEPLGKTVQAAFQVKNTGSGALTLTVPKIATLLEGCWPPEIVVGQTTLQPGESTTISMDFMMHEGMGGKHLFEVPVQTNDPSQLRVNLQVASNWVPGN